MQTSFAIFLSPAGTFHGNRPFASVTDDLIILNRTPVAFADHDKWCGQVGKTV